MGQRIESHFWIWVGVFLGTLLVGVLGNFSSIEFVHRPYVDKLAHLLYLGAFATLLSERLKMWQVILSGTLLALFIELIQAYTPGRSCDINDAMWGIVGVWFAWGLYQARWWRTILTFKLW